MKVRGLEGALVSHSRKTVASLAPNAHRACILNVAGPAALLLAKVHKIGERIEDPDARRHTPLGKDAFDIHRILRPIETVDLASELKHLRLRRLSSHVTTEALSMFRRLFSTTSGMGTEFVVRTVGDLEDPDFIAASSVALSQDLLESTAV